MERNRFKPQSQAEDFDHVIVNLFQPIAIATTDFSRGPAHKTDLIERRSHIRPIDVTLADFGEFACTSIKPFGVQLDDALRTELADRRLERK